MNMSWKKAKRIAKKVWHFIWVEDSIASWAVNIVLAFVLIKFIIYPGLGFLMGTTHPVVAVVSGSMEHKTVHPCLRYDISRQCVLKDTNTYEICGKKFSSRQNVNLDFYWDTCGGYYEEIGITEDVFGEYPFKNGFNTGDIIILKGAEPEDVEVGDVIVFAATQTYPIIHRVIEKKYEDGEIVFATKGDHNSIQTPDDLEISEKNVIGKAIIRVPYLGWIKIGFFKILDWAGILKLANYLNSGF